MDFISLKNDKLKEALVKFNKSHNIVVAESKKTSKVLFSKENKEFLQFVLGTALLTDTQRNKITAWLFGGERLATAESNSLNDFFSKVSFITTAEDPVLEIKIVNKWYPVKVAVDKFRVGNNSHIVELVPYSQLGGINYSKRIYIGEWEFTGPDDKPLKRNIGELLKKHDLRIASPESLAHAKKLSSKLLEYSTQAGQVYDVWGTGLAFHDFWGWYDINAGWKEAPSMAVIETTLENKFANREIGDDSPWNLPFIRVFSLKHKSYMFIDVENMEKHIYHRTGKDKIVLPSNMMNALESVFNAPQGGIFGDIFHGRHGGIVVLANGPSGVGKTLTAEVFAEYQERPLYSMEMGEIGTSLREVEQNLQKIFARAKKWNAVLLFDEADIFLSERVASDLERSAIVGIFLRLLDYYEGTFFLTTNRGEGIDTAFKSRVTLYLDYPALTPQTRETIWKNMLSAAKMEVHEVRDPKSDWAYLCRFDLNGRQIRNQVRLLKLMYPDGKITTADIVDAMKFAAK